MKILFATSSFGGGGITSYAHEVINNFSKDNDFSVLIGDDKVSPITTPGVKIYKYECRDLSVNNALAVIDVINNEIRPDLILSNNAWIISLVAKYLDNNIKIVTLSHSLRYEEADMAAIAYKYVDKVIAASSIYNKEYLKKRFSIDGEKIDIILNFVEELPDAEVWRRKKIENTSPCLIAFPGGASGSKSPDIVLKIALELAKTDLNFVLNWNKKTQITGKNLGFLNIRDIKDFISDERIKFLGRLPTRQDAIDLISSAHIFLAPSRREGCPIALLEAMRAGTIPLVADFDVANKEMIKDGYNGFIIGHNDIQGWVNRIRDIVENPHKYDSIYENSYNSFKELYTYPVWKKNMEKALSECQNNHTLRKKKVSKIELTFKIMYYKFDLLRCHYELLYNEGFKVLCQFLKIKYFKH